ncbi:response regulator [Ideonella azotifigens]|uniref:Response regulatory domain-containing protein n=1 Tax=Ideonella azotifigens TaxID=513160 RepID=A0ABN1K4E3_9BURK|nr:response regulator [Ideonella azotifigens]MCD2344326.1 response regulator [Ideonella azotifigens]
MHNVLLVDDEPAILNALQRALRQQFGKQLRLDTGLGGAQALSMGLERRYDIVISDLRMPGMDGLDFLCRFAKLQPHSTRMMLTGSADFGTAQRAVNEIGVFRYLTKPWQEDDLGLHMRAALAHADSLRTQRDAADAWASSQGQLSPQELERRRLEALEPGITLVEWAADGAVIMPSLD